MLVGRPATAVVGSLPIELSLRLESLCAIAEANSLVVSRPGIGEVGADLLPRGRVFAAVLLLSLAEVERRLAPELVCLSESREV